MFYLDRTLKKDTYWLGDFPLSRLLLSRDANYPWFILVPRRNGVTEICDLTDADQRQLLKESSSLSHLIRDLFMADKLNVAALGNVVSQLHVHHIVRYKDDLAWPAPVWGKHDVSPYAEPEYGRVMGLLAALSVLEGFQYAP
ncbi:MAG: HIT domain-containing protein [Pseudomonadales bacterium]